jgi:hypothetical protein
MLDNQEDTIAKQTKQAIENKNRLLVSKLAGSESSGKLSLNTKSTSFSEPQQQMRQEIRPQRSAVYSGSAINEALNRSKDYLSVSPEEMTYTDELIEKIRLKHAARAKKIKITFAIVVGIIAFIVILLYVFVPDFSQIVPIE